jgi:putative pyruvate formate lyase activating enzyme
MCSQQPVLYIGKENTAEKGLILRHLVLPGQVEDSLKILNWVAEKLTASIGLSLMSQYSPCFKTPDEFNRTLTPKEYGKVLDYSKNIGLEYLFSQPEPFYPDENLLPDFLNKKPFNFK